MKKPGPFERIAVAMERLADSQERIASAMEKMEAAPDPVTQAMGDWWSIVQGFYPMSTRKVQ